MQLPLSVISPNGATHQITGTVVYTGQNLELRAPLVVRANAELRLQRSILKVFGNVRLEEGSRLTVLDSAFLVPVQPAVPGGLYEMRNEGGLIHTERSVFGSDFVGGRMNQLSLLHLRGSWLARQTVLQGLVTTLSDGRFGWFGDPALKGGSLYADGLYEGDSADAIHMSGMGDAVLANGTMNIGVHFDASYGTQPSNNIIDLNARTPLTAVQGDPAAHAGVTVPISGHASRLELINHRSVGWQFFATKATSTGPLRTLTLRNAEDIICNFRGVNLSGPPILGGPWSTYYANLPGLPSTAPPGHHALPPGCSVQLGNVKFQSGPGPTDWNRIRAWGLYGEGLGTNLSVTGPSMISEVQLKQGSMQLRGTGSFDMGFAANRATLDLGASLLIDNAALGGFGYESWINGLVDVAGASTCTITNSRTSRITMRTVGAGAAITATNLFGLQNVTVNTSAGGSVVINQANTSQNWDLQNLGFESPLVAGAPPWWSANAVSGTRQTDVAASIPGTASYELIASAANGGLQKQLTLPPETFVTVLGMSKLINAPSGQLTLAAAQGAARSSVLLSPTLNTWKLFQVPLLTTTSATGPTTLRLNAGTLPTTVRLDDVRVAISSWWDSDNLANLDFELGYRNLGQFPSYYSAPDAWGSQQGGGAPDTSNVRPGAAPGSRSLRFVADAQASIVFKDMTFFRAGDRVTVTGWARAVNANASTAMYAQIGDGDTFWQTGPGLNNVNSGPLSPAGAWQSFSMQYVVPTNPTFTRLALALFNTPGGQCWFDDLTITVTRP